MSLKVDVLGREALINCAKTSMSSKIIGAEMNLFSEMVVDAITSVKTMNSIGDSKYPVKNVNIVKSHGGSTVESRLFKGYIL